MWNRASATCVPGRGRNGRDVYKRQGLDSDYAVQVGAVHAAVLNEQVTVAAGYFTADNLSLIHICTGAAEAEIRTENHSVSVECLLQAGQSRLHQSLHGGRR